MKTYSTYVSDVLDIDKTIKQHGNKILLIAGVGSGKSSWVKNVLTKKGTVLFITSRKAKVEEDTNCSCFSEAFKWYTNDNQTLITNAKLSSLVERLSSDFQNDLDDFINHFDYFVIDEVHSIATDSQFAESCSGILSFIEYVAEKGKSIIAMTGTPEPIIDYFTANNWHILDLLHTCKYVHPKNIRLTTNKTVPTIITKDINSRKVIYFANRTDTMIKLCANLIESLNIAPNEIALIVSKSKEKEFSEKLSKTFSKEIFIQLETASKKAYENIVLNTKIPDDCKILFSTSTLREGVDITNENITMICENHVLTNLIQFFGRARGENSDVYVIEDTVDHRINHDSLLYDYGIVNEMNAANNYLHQTINTIGNPFIEIEKQRLIKHVTQNPYIYFDYISNSFKIFHIKHNEECRLLNSLDWKMELWSYCQNYNIRIAGHLNLKKDLYDALLIMAEKGTLILKEKVPVVLNALKWAYNIDSKQPKTINLKLQEMNAPIRVVSKKHNSGTYRNKTLWTIVKAD